MMKKVMILYVFLVSIVTLAQQRASFSINWKNIEVNSASSTIEIMGFDENNLQFSGSDGLFYTNKWKESNRINPKTARIENVVYENISKSVLRNIDITTIPSTIKYKITSSIARNVRQGYVRISPIIRKGVSFQKIISFDVVYEYANSSYLKRNKIAITNSVLSSGDWFRFAIDKTGVYKITPDFLNSLGMNLSSVDPNTIKIYGNGGKMLPLLNQENTQYDLTENAIQVVSGGDGDFSGNDYILLYGEGTTGFSEENMTNLNLYADNSYYYITAGGANGLRISDYIEPSGIATEQINTFTDYKFYEVDETNIAKLGRRWYGDRFDIETSREYTFDFPNLIITEPLEVRVLGAATSSSSSVMNILLNGNQVGNLNFSQISGSNLVSERTFTQLLSVNKEKVDVTLNYNNNGNPSAVGYLDFVSVKAQRQLIADNSQFLFYNENTVLSNGIGEYIISNTANVSQVWDVTDVRTIAAIKNNNSATISFKSTLGALRKYVAVVSENYYQPSVDEITRISNQNIKGTIFLNDQGQFEDIDYVIITKNSFLNAANRLAQHHRSTNGYNVKVISLENIYHEFASGKQDIVAIRNLIKYIYDNASIPSERLKYLCLLGDGSVDYKNRLSSQNCGDSNIVPVFQSLNSSSLVSSFATDDFYGSLDPEEGRMLGSDMLDVAIGRILADTPQLAEAMVSKIIKYDEEQSYGRWRNTVLLIADDVDEDWEEQIQRNLNELGDDLNQRKPFFNINKIYADSYEQESTASGKRYPKINKAISDAIEEGAVAINYFGHGGEDGMAKEFIFNKSDAVALKNEYKFPFLVTVTCEFTKFDNPCRDTAGELLYNNIEGGAVGMISTTRDVLVTFGISVNDRLTNFLFPNGAVYPTVAEAVKQLKNSYTTNSKRVVFFFGDPAMKMAIPKPDIRLTKINDVPISGQMDVLSALSKVKISGEVLNESGTLFSSYNGILSTTIYDKNVARETLANDNITNSLGQLIKLNYTSLGEVIFRGKASVKNGIFDFEFVVPRDIGISEGNGKISFYSAKDGALENQTGVNQTILIGGINENAPEDNLGPEIELFMNDENFVSGGVTNDSPILIAKLKDDNGINTASGIGHDISVILDGDESNPFIMNDFYETIVDDYTQGVVNFKFRDLSPGLHTLTFKGWDVYNNSSISEIEFTVTKNEGFRLSNVLNYPNPFVSHTEFWFEHSGSVIDLLEVQVQVLTVSGKVVWTTNQSLSGKTSYKEEIQWNAKDNFGNKLAKGVYVYKISVKSTLTNQRVEKFEKLVIL